MGVFYPQCAVELLVVWENMQKEIPTLEKSYPIMVTPKRVEVSINSYKEADKFTCELDFKNFPFDPRSIRALGVNIFMENMGRLRDEKGNPVRIVPRRENKIFTGYADEETIKLDDNAGVVSFSGRDYTALLLDRPFVNSKGVIPKIDLSKPLDVTISAMLKSLPETKEIKVVNRTGAKSLPSLASFAPDYSPLGSHKNAGKKDKYWEVIQDLVGKAALVAYIELDELIIAKPRALYEGTNAKQFIYGKNLKSLEFKRKLGRVKGFNVQVQSLDFANKKPVIVKIPEQASDEWSAATGIAKEQVKVPKPGTNGQITEQPAPTLVFNVPDIKSRDQLIKIGEGIFEDVSRQEIEGQAVTYDMMLSEIKASEGGFASVGEKSYATRSDEGFDVLKIRNATPIAIFMDWEDLQYISQLTTEAKRIEYLQQRNFNPTVAAALAQVIGRYPNVFYTRSVKFSMSDENFQCEVEFINFVRAPTK